MKGMKWSRDAISGVTRSTKKSFCCENPILYSSENFSQNTDGMSLTSKKFTRFFLRDNKIGTQPEAINDPQTKEYLACGADDVTTFQ